jgi:hypothetical protein
MAETPTPAGRDVSRETVRHHRDSVGPSLEAPCRAVEERKTRCPCCDAVQPAHSAIAYCDDCNTDTCGHWTDR